MVAPEPFAAEPAALALFSQCQQSRVSRDARQLLYLEGARSFLQALEAGHGERLQQLLVSEPLMIPRLQKQVRLLRRRGVPCLSVSPESFRTLAMLERASGLMALMTQPWQSLHQLRPEPGSVWVALEQVRSLGNLGTLIRSAEAFGAAGFILLGPSVDVFAPPVVRASMGAIFHQRFTRCRLETFSHWVRRHHMLVLGASPEAEARSLKASRRPVVLLLGAEREGLSAAQRDLCERTVAIPMRGRVDSLNLSVAGSLLLYELLLRKP